jgi:hypothetical protein
MQVLNNLLSNAAKFSPSGGEVTLRLMPAEEEWVRLSVQDRGPGIPESFRPRVFQRFAQADSSDRRQRGGTGLGLSISKAIVDRLGGRIGFETGPGGTTFHVELPLCHDPQASNTPRVLICEDDPVLSRCCGSCSATPAMRPTRPAPRPRPVTSWRGTPTPVRRSICACPMATA